MLTRRGFLTALGAAPLAAAETIHQSVVNMTRNAPLRLRFIGRSREDFAAWHAAFDAKLRELLGPYITPPLRWETKIEDEVRQGSFTRQRLLLSAPGFRDLPLYLLVPHGAGAKRPAMIALHGHGAGFDVIVGRDDTEAVANEIRVTNADYGRQFAERGYVVAAPCLTPFGPRVDDPKRYEAYLGLQDKCAIESIRLQMLGRLLIAENLRDVRWAASLLEQHASADPDRIGCAGLSYGGRMTMLAAAIDSRIKAAVVSGALNLMQERIENPYSCGAQLIPSLLEWGDTPEIASLIAPRPLLWEIGMSDTLLPAPWRENARTRICAAYTAAGAEENLIFEHHPGGHAWYGRGADEFLAKALRNS